MKKIKLLGLFSILLCIGVVNVNAATDFYSCTYKNEMPPYSFTMTVKDDYSVTYTKPEVTGDVIYYYIGNDKKISQITEGITKNKLTDCPNVYSCQENDQFWIEKEGNSGDCRAISGKKKILNEIKIPESEKMELVCSRYQKLRVASNNETGVTMEFYKRGNEKFWKISGSSQVPISNSISASGRVYKLTDDVIKQVYDENKCGQNLILFFSCPGGTDMNGQGTIIIQKNNPGSGDNCSYSSSIGDDENADDDDGTEKKPDDESGADPENVTETNGHCPIGKNVAQDIKGAWNIMKIVIPLLAIALTILDAIKAIGKGDVSSETKKIVTRFGKRIAFVIVLFFINALVSLLLEFFLPTEYCSLTNMTEGNGVETKD